MGSPRPPAEKKGREAAASLAWMRFRRERRAGAAFFGKPEVVRPKMKLPAASCPLAPCSFSQAGRSISWRGACGEHEQRRCAHPRARCSFLACRTGSTGSAQERGARGARGAREAAAREAARKQPRRAREAAAREVGAQAHREGTTGGATDKQQGAHFLRDFCAQVGHLCCCVSGYMLFTCCWFLSSISLC